MDHSVSVRATYIVVFRRSCYRYRPNRTVSQSESRGEIGSSTVLDTKQQILAFRMHYRSILALLCTSLATTAVAMMRMSHSSSSRSSHPLLESSLSSSSSSHRTIDQPTTLETRSNATHLYWSCSCPSSSSLSSWQTIAEARKESYDYLLQNVMNFDRPFVHTMGFHDGNDTDDSVDGLANGLIGPVLDHAIQAKIQFAYTDRLPKSIWREYVLNYANLNEARNNIRPLLWNRVIQPLFFSNDTNISTEDKIPDNEHRTIADTVRILNTHMWKLLAPASSSSTTIVFVAGQTPAIFDPMSVLVYGYASCTGLAILFVQTLRAAGVPARVVGTPAWNGNVSHGNHNWVEVYDTTTKNYTIPTKTNPKHHQTRTFHDHWKEDPWSFLEPSPGVDPNDVDTLDRDPCQRWFCHPDRFENTQTFAARLDSQRADTPFFPLAWEPNSHRHCGTAPHVPADNRTEYYRRVCQKQHCQDLSIFSSVHNTMASE